MDLAEFDADCWDSDIVKNFGGGGAGVMELEVLGRLGSGWCLGAGLDQSRLDR